MSATRHPLTELMGLVSAIKQYCEWSHHKLTLRYPLFSLPPELRNLIYNYLFASVKITRFNRRPLPVDLDIVTVVTTSDVLLRTCRFAQLGIRGIFYRSPARRKFWENNSFVLDLDDSRYDDAIRLDQEYDRAVFNGIEDDDAVPVASNRSTQRSKAIGNVHSSRSSPINRACRLRTWHYHQDIAFGDSGFSTMSTPQKGAEVRNNSDSD